MNSDNTYQRRSKDDPKFSCLENIKIPPFDINQLAKNKAVRKRYVLFPQISKIA